MGDNCMKPVDFGFKMPPEWDRHLGTFMEWPVVEAVWPGNYDEVLESYTAVVKAISEFEPVNLIASHDTAEEARKYCGEFAKIIEMPHNDSWMRDNGPTIVKNSKGELAGVNWIFNAWGEKYPCKEDNLVASSTLDYMDIPCFNAPFVMEGGSIHVDGEGTLLTTEECLLNDKRNPHLKKEDIEELLKQYLGIEKIIWLKKGLYGDDTDGHVDNVACFAKPGTIIIQTSSNKEDPNYQISQENLEILKNTTDARGRKFEIIEIEQPAETFYEDMRLTLSYINFYFVNGGIILPVFGGVHSETDKKAEDTLKKVFPDRKVALVKGLVIARGGGNVHCLTQQIPFGVPAVL